ncbi:MAG TPA: ATP-binding protein [Thermoanaerobaculia bacterium]|nr:ATP-binding protein [Thermoanaerobaculia bacterium]
MNLESPDFRVLFESSPGLYLVLTPDFRIVAVSEAYLQATMTSREAILGRDIFEVFPDNPADPAATGVRNLKASLERVVRDRVADLMAVQKYDVRRPAADGGAFEERYWSPVNSPVFDAANRLTYIIHRVEDVTGFVRLTQHDREQQVLTESLRIRSEQMEAEVMQRSQEIQEANRKLLDAKAKLEQRVHERTVELAAANEALRAEIDQTRRLEEQVRQSQKMEAIGTLAGGVAHDFNNLLTIVLGYSEVVLAQIDTADPLRIPINEIKNASERAASLTRQLLAFSRQQVLESKVLDLNAIVANIEKMLQRVIGEDISLTTVLEPNLGKVRADPGQIDQIVLNLAVNAREAMPRGGHLTLETSNVELDQSYTADHVEVQPGEYVMLAVSDTGCGMDATTRARAFDPFFTTKPQGKGTGLGLATVFGIVKQSGGHIWVYSEPGKGTTFKVYLPLLEDEPTSSRPRAQPSAPSGTETILVVEDEAAVRKIAVFALESYGYTVLQGSHGQEAIELCEQYSGEIHLLISDVIMPELGGREVADRALALRPEMRVLFLSGYTDDTIVRHGVLHEHVAFLQKPFTPGSLARKVREVLGS